MTVPEKKLKLNYPNWNLDTLFQGQAWSARELAEKLNLSVDTVRQKLVVLINYGSVIVVKEGRYNLYLLRKDRDRYLESLGTKERLRFLFAQRKQRR